MICFYMKSRVKILVVIYDVILNEEAMFMLHISLSSASTVRQISVCGIGMSFRRLHLITCFILEFNVLKRTPI